MPDPVGCTFAVAKLSGATTIIATERFPHRAAMAKHYGADEVLQCPLDEASAAVKKSTGGRGCDVVFEVAGAVDTPTAAASMCKKGGTLCVVGICAADSVSTTACRRAVLAGMRLQIDGGVFQMSVRHSTARRAGLTIKMVRRMKHTYPRCIAIAEKGLVDLR